MCVYICICSFSCWSKAIDCNRDTVFTTSNPLFLSGLSTLILKETTGMFFQVAIKIQTSAPPALGWYLLASTSFHMWQAQTGHRAAKFKLESHKMTPDLSLFSEHGGRISENRIIHPTSIHRISTHLPGSQSLWKPDHVTYLAPPEYNKHTIKLTSKISATKRTLSKGNIKKNNKFYRCKMNIWQRSYLTN